MRRKTLRNFVAGKWHIAHEIIRLSSPLDEDISVEVPVAASSDVEDACSNGRAAQATWARATPAARGRVLAEAARLLGDEQWQGSIVRTICEEVGKPSAEAHVEVAEAADVLNFCARMGPSALNPEVNPIDADLWPSRKSQTHFCPVGVVALVKPWNYPFELPLWSISSALIAGNAVVLKPSEHSPRSALEIARLFEAAMLPPGVLSVLCGGRSVAETLIANPHVGMVGFTGGTSTGRLIAAACAASGKRVALELSGNDAAIVCADADLDYTARGLVWGAISNAGQVCTGTKRVLVHADVADDLVRLIRVVVDTLRPGIDYGPLISHEAVERVTFGVKDAVDRGATLVTGGDRLSRKGFYVAPVVLDNVSTDAFLWSNEIFGPLLPIARFTTMESAIDLANKSEYGLGASVWTGDLAEGEKIASALDVGMVWINDVNLPMPAGPWATRKASGNGVDLSIHGIREYTNLKHVCIETASPESQEWWYPYAS